MHPSTWEPQPLGLGPDTSQFSGCLTWGMQPKFKWAEEGRESYQHLLGCCWVSAWKEKIISNPEKDKMVVADVFDLMLESV